MNQKKIGKFIADLRKEKNFTQRELAERLGISEKTVSKWECGNGMPEVVYMEPLCGILGITVNELLIGEPLNLAELFYKLDRSRLELMKQLEFEELRFRIYRLYGLEIEQTEISEKGAGSLTYFVTAGNQKYVVKYASDNEMNHPELEPRLCAYLREHGIPASEFVKNLQGQVISVDENGRRFHVQKFIAGVTYEYNEAPEFLFEKAAKLLAKIHMVLQTFDELPEGIGARFFQYRRPEMMAESFKNTLQIALQNGDEENVRDIRTILAVLERFPRYEFEVSKLTCGNTHGDYMISQLLCENNEIKGIIDWTTACRHPLIWEVVRSYIFMAPECKEGRLDVDCFERYLRIYLTEGGLNAYDIQNAGRLFYYFLAVCDFYGQYYQSLARNRKIYLEQAKLAKGMLVWFDEHIDVLDKRLEQLAREYA
ncbi:MAG: phosphotransferase [Lachnospiraceae bacterium]|nr:phosphotransferase [Lachnospiraceae bacterium]